MSNDLGIDRSGNGNNWTVNNLAYSDQMVDSPTNNFCTLNPIDNYGAKPLSEGNLKCTGSVSTCFNSTTFWVETGKWYFESLVTAIGSGSGDGFRIGFTNDVCRSGVTASMNIAWTIAYAANGHVYDGTTLVSSGAASYVANDIVAMAIDLDAGTPTLKIYKNNVLQLTRNISAAFQDVLISPFMGDQEAGTIGGVMNFGQDSSFAGGKTAQGNTDSNDIGDFYYTPPTGYLALCTSNLPAVAVVPSEHFNTILYTGNGSTQSITGVNFQPDMVWAKQRTEAYHHTIWDAVRGATYEVFPNRTVAEQIESTGLTSFDSDGFSLAERGNANESGDSIVAWNWKANGSGSSNTDGSITSTVSANADAGFSIVSYTGTGSAGTVGHGLSSAPEMIIIKDRDTARNWGVYGSDFYKLRLNSTLGDFGSSAQDVTSNSSALTINTDGDVNISGDDYIAYCFHSVDGYSKVGSYTGNGNADGTFVYTGFRPAFVMIRRTDSNAQWTILDNKRDLYNVSKKLLYADSSSAEQDGITDRSPDWLVDFNSNGFKLRATNSDSNGNSANLIYIAFASVPFKFGNAR